MLLDVASVVALTGSAGAPVRVWHVHCGLRVHPLFWLFKWGGPVVHGWTSVHHALGGAS